MTGLGNIDDVYKHYLKVIDENQKLKEQLKEAEKILCKVMDCREDREFYRDLAYEYYAKRSEMK